MPVAFDTSVVVAGLLAWHEHHEPARVAIESALRDDEVILPAPVLVESYAVMTRLPAPHRVAADVAVEVLRGSFAGRVRVAGVAARTMWRFLGWAADSSVVGGRTYDAQILAGAIASGATRLVTFNERHFRGLDERIEIAAPIQ